MRFVSNDPGELGFIAVGQFATGVIAVGQVARGVIAIGQLAFGLVAIGQCAVGIFYATGMLAVAGRKGWGLGFPFIASIGAARVPPKTTTLQAIASSGPAWIDASVGTDAHGPGLFEAGQRLPVKLDRHLLSATKTLVADGTTKVTAFTRSQDGRFIADRLVFVPARPYREKGFFLLAGLQTAVLIGMGCAFWPAVGNDLLARARPASVVAPPPAATPHGRSGGRRPGH